MFQWGATAATAPGGVITFPLAFSAAPIVTIGHSGPTGTFPTVASRSSVSFDLGVSAASDVMWLAIGIK